MIKVSVMIQMVRIMYHTFDQKISYGLKIVISILIFNHLNQPNLSLRNYNHMLKTEAQQAISRQTITRYSRALTHSMYLKHLSMHRKTDPRSKHNLPAPPHQCYIQCLKCNIRPFQLIFTYSRQGLRVHEFGGVKIKRYLCRDIKRLSHHALLKISSLARHGDCNIHTIICHRQTCH